LNIEQLISLIYLASGLILFMLAVIILRENLGNRLNRVVGMMLFFAGIAPFSTAIYKSVLEGMTGLPPWFVNTFYIWELFFPALLYFAAIFPEPSPAYVKHKRLLQFAFLPHVIHLLMVLLLADPDRILNLLSFQSEIPILGQLLQLVSSLLKIVTAFLGFLLLFHKRFFSLINLIYVVAALYLLRSGFRRIENPRLKQQVSLVIYGILIAVGLYVAGFLIPEILMFNLPSSLRDSMVVAALLVGPGTIAWAIVKYQFLDIGLIARRSLVYTITTTIVVGGYFLLVAQLSSMLRSIIGQESQVLNVLIIIVMLMFFQPIYNQVDDFVRKIFIRSRGDYSHLVETFSREIISIFQTDRLALTVSDTLRREMFIENAEICFINSDAEFVISWPGQPSTALKFEPEISAYLLTKRAPAFCEEFSSRAKAGGLGAEIVSLGVQIVVPLVKQEKLEGLLLLSSKVAGFRYSSEDLTFLTILANQILVAMENAELYTEALAKQRLEEELAVAKQIQIGLLPKTLPMLRCFDFAAYTEPSRQVGGDYYDFINIRDGRLGIVIADASGKGVPAALLIARMQAVIQSESKLGKDVHEVVHSVNTFISASNRPDRFATCFYAELDEDSQWLHYCNAGHNYPIIIRKNGEIISLSTGGLLLGAFSYAKYESDSIELQPGDILVMYTDGLSEMMDSEEREYGEARIIESAYKYRNESVEVICSMLIKGVKQFSGGPNEIDDMTLVVIKAKEDDNGAG
jgi:serine phosphatase RsbU (regulator of sigma subunit)